MLKKIVVFVLGVFVMCVVLEGSLRLGTGVYVFWKETQNRSRLKKTGVCRIVCFGDSMTEKAYPGCLEIELNQRAKGVKYVVIDKGKSATTSDFVVSILTETLNEYKPDIVICMMGFNDNGDVLPYGRVSIEGENYFYLYRMCQFLWFAVMERWKEQHSAGRGINTAQSEQHMNTLSTNEMFGEKENFLKRKIAEQPHEEKLYGRLGRLYWEYNKYDKAIVVYNQMISMNSRNGWAYAELGQCYRDLHLPEKSRAMYEKAIEVAPDKKYGYEKLGWYHHEQNKREEAITVYQRAIAANSKAMWAYVELGRWYMEFGQYALAEEVLHKAEDLCVQGFTEATGLYNPYMVSAACYKAQGKYAEAIAVVLRDIALHPHEQHNYAYLGELYEIQGDIVQAEKCYQKNRVQKLRTLNKKTRNNYQIVKNEVLRRGITLVCMQYPMQDIEVLKALVAPLEKGIIFVDNNQVFRDAVRRSAYTDIFIDNYGGDFGHCTAQGAKIMAKNIADVILRLN